MYKLIKVRDIVQIPPKDFDKNLKEAALNVLMEKYEGTFSKSDGLIVSIKDIEEIGEGRVVPTEGGTHHKVIFNALAFEPQDGEIIEGWVSDATDYAAFIRIGPKDGMVHISQLMDEYVSFDEKNLQFAGKDTNKLLKVDDNVRGRVVSISTKKDLRIKMTMRQPGLGKLQWIEDEREKEVEKTEEEEEND